MSGSPRLLDLFSGAGGFSRGFRDLGYEVLLAVDNDKSAAKTYSANFPGSLVVNEDVRKISCDDFRYAIGRIPVDVVIGSPPCEPFTAANPRRQGNPLDRLYSDPVGTLVLEFIRVIECVKPRVFVMENVLGILEGELRKAIKVEFAKAGYTSIHYNILKAENYGSPSRRTRVFVSNVRIDPPKVGVRRTVWDAIGDLPTPSQDPEVPNHENPPSLSTKKLKKAAKLGFGRALVMYRGYRGKLYPNLIRLDPMKTAPTVLGSSRFIHPYELRLLTVREQARLMSYPDDHVFFGGRDEQYNQVGESVPPVLSSTIARYLLKYLT
ncbi:MAG: DNA cytosine methyltransferase [Sulfolobales archaeon]|nr:DNA cytosine methyltransferase [Sulfolobales archaeon]MCX8208351.1 DNA cytosine methyltransferase [Sulfolobales archaeon]MDW8011170.1 DNA cytosine methyltransferase [Sulfolobales archaeon]